MTLDIVRQILNQTEVQLDCLLKTSDFIVVIRWRRRSGRFFRTYGQKGIAITGENDASPPRSEAAIGEVEMLLNETWAGNKMEPGFAYAPET
jgi:hypothetical protein